MNKENLPTQQEHPSKESPPQEPSLEEPPPQEPITQEPIHLPALPPPYSVQPTAPPKDAPQTEEVIVKKVKKVTLRQYPVEIVCPYCHFQIMTRVKPKINSKTHQHACCLCILTGALCVWVPYLCDDWKTRNHYCPHCRSYLGKYDP